MLTTNLVFITLYISCHILKSVGKAILFCVVGGPPLAMPLKSPEILAGSEAEQPAKSVTEPHLSLNEAAYSKHKLMLSILLNRVS